MDSLAMILLTVPILYPLICQASLPDRALTPSGLA